MYCQNRFDIENPDKDIEKEIKSIFEEHRGRYGYRRITATLRDCGIVINQKKVRRIMNKLALKCIAFSHEKNISITFDSWNLYKSLLFDDGLI